MVHTEPFTPHPYETLGNAFPEGAVTQRVYDKLCRDYAALEGAHVQRITYTVDGCRVTGLAALPAEIREGFHPILIYNRGGNREYGKLTVYQAVQTLAPLAKMGYLVFASNYRGNDGGTGAEEFGGADVKDVLTLLDFAKTHPGWNGQDAYMMGHSRGGMMTYLALKNGAKVNAAISIAGIAGLTHLATARPEMEEKVYRKIIPGADRESAYRARSAVCWPEAISSPLLLLHGDGDDAVDVSHSLRLSEALQQAGKTHELMIYPKGNHALVRYWPEVLKTVDDWCVRHRSSASRKQATCG